VRPASRIPAIVALAALSLFYLVVCMPRSVIVYDEGLILFGAERVRNGDVPHQDFYANYGPAQFYLLAALYKLFGVSVVVERALDTVERCCCVILVFVLVDRAVSRGHAVLAATASLVWLQYFGAYGYPIFPALAAALASLVFLMSAVRGTGAPLGLVAGGGCAGVVALFRYDIGLGVFAAEFVLLALLSGPVRRPAPGDAPFVTSLRLMFGSPSLRGVVRTLVAFSLGFLAVTGPVAVAFACIGVIPDLIFDIYTTASNYARMRAMPFPRPAALWANPSEFGVYLPLILCAAAVPRLFSMRAGKGFVGLASAGHASDSAHPPAIGTTLSLRTLSVLIVMTLGFFTKGLVHVSALFMSMALITSLVLLAVLAQSLQRRGRVDRIVVVTALLMTGAVTLYNVRNALHQGWWNIDWARNATSWEVTAADEPPELGSCRMPAGLERLSCMKVRPGLAQAVRYTQQRTGPKDPVFVGLSRHDKIFGNDMLFCFVLNRPSATKWHHFDPGLQTSAPIQQLMIGELRGARPKLIILVNWGELTDPNDSSRSSGVTLLDDYIRQAYQPVATFGVYNVLRARTS
jgi:hypothetical protein